MHVKAWRIGFRICDRAIQKQDRMLHSRESSVRQGGESDRRKKGVEKQNEKYQNRATQAKNPYRDHGTDESTSVIYVTS